MQWSTHRGKSLPSSRHYPDYKVAHLLGNRIRLCVCALGLILLLLAPRQGKSFLLSRPQSPQLIQEGDIIPSRQGGSASFFQHDNMCGNIFLMSSFRSVLPDLVTSLCISQNSFGMTIFYGYHKIPEAR